MRPFVGAIGLALLVAACSSEPSPSPKPPCPTGPPTSTSAQASLADASVATVTVSGAVSGTFEIDLLGEAAPLATANFVELARCGFYDGISFHRVLAGFVIQAGDPQTKDNRGDFPELGSGGPGYQFVIEAPPDDVPFDGYTVAMANAAPQVADSNGSQFFITLADLDQQLRASGTYTIFGDVVAGTELIDSIAAVPVNDPRVGVPLDPVVIDTIAISAGPTPSPGE